MWLEGRLDLRKPATFVEYFARLYGMAEQDTAGVMAAERTQRFAEAAKLFRMIDDSGEPVVAPYGDWQARVEEIRQRGISRDRMRRLQPLLVSLYRRQEIEPLLQAGALERIEDMFWVVAPGFRVYAQRWGFGWAGRLYSEPEDLIA
jgi:hypothetical protein